MIHEPSLGKLCLFLLPLMSVVSQWISIGGIKVSWLISVVLAVIVIMQYEKLQKSKVILTFCFLNMILPLVTAGFSISFSLNMSLYFSIFTGFVYLLYIYGLNEKEYDIFIDGCFFSCCICVVLSLIEIYTGMYLFSSEEVFTVRLNNYNMHYPIVAFANVNDLAQYLIVVFYVSLWRIWEKCKFIVIINYFLIIFVLLHTHSRLGLLLFFAILPLVFLLDTLIVKKRINIGILGSAMFLFGIGLILLECVRGIFGEICYAIKNYDLNMDFIKLRLDIYIPLLEHALENPIGGFGDSYVINELPPHNLFLFILCDYGWLAITLFISFLIFLFVEIVRKIKKNKENIEYIYILALIIIFPILSIISSGNEQRKAIWILLGIFVQRAISCKDIINKDTEEHSVCESFVCDK